MTSLHRASPLLGRTEPSKEQESQQYDIYLARICHELQTTETMTLSAQESVGRNDQIRVTGCVAENSRC